MRNSGLFIVHVVNMSRQTMVNRCTHLMARAFNKVIADDVSLGPVLS